MRIRNLVVYSDDVKKLKLLADDYRFMGFDVDRRDGKLVIFCINRKLKSRKVRMREMKNKQKFRK